MTEQQIEGITVPIGGRLSKRCHTIEFGQLHKMREWFHAFVPTIGEVMAIDPEDKGGLVAFVDKFVLIGESSFADESFQTAAQMPHDLFGAVASALLTSGRPVSGNCHR